MGSHPQHIEIPRLGVQSELPAYATATAPWDVSCVWDLHHSTWQRWILNPLSEARDQTCVLMDTSWVYYCCATMETPGSGFLMANLAGDTPPHPAPPSWDTLRDECPGHSRASCIHAGTTTRTKRPTQRPASLRHAVQMSLSVQLGLNLSASHVTVGKSLLSRPQFAHLQNGEECHTSSGCGCRGWIQSGVSCRENIWSLGLSLQLPGTMGPPSEARLVSSHSFSSRPREAEKKFRNRSLRPRRAST